MTILLFASTLISIPISVVVSLVIVKIAMPLRDDIYEEIFVEIGGTMNTVLAYKAKIAFYATSKVDMVIHIVNLNTLVFLAYEFALHFDVSMVPYISVLASFLVIAIFNNVQGHVAMIDPSPSQCRTKSYYLTRVALQALYIYVAFSMIANKSLKWNRVESTAGKSSELESLKIVCFVLTCFSFTILGFLMWTASRLREYAKKQKCFYICPDKNKEAEAKFFVNESYI